MNVIKKMFIGVTFAVFSTVSFADIHAHPKASLEDKKNQFISCSIEIVNASQYDVVPYGQFLDNSTLTPFISYSYTRDHFISLLHWGRCDSGFNLRIASAHGKILRNVYVPVNTVVTIQSAYGKFDAEIKPKQ